jgi:hypothetical protein
MTSIYRSTAGALLASAVLLVAGCETGGALPEDEALLAVGCDDNGDSPTDKACTEDCTRPCGFDAQPVPRALKYCECESGVYIECRCPRPEWYKGAPSAPYCDNLTDDGLGIAETLHTDPCEKEWDQCVGRDIVDGFTPRGCVCLFKRSESDDMRGVMRLEWDCGSTEKWFYPDQSTIP